MSIMYLCTRYAVHLYYILVLRVMEIFILIMHLDSFLYGYNVVESIHNRALICAFCTNVLIFRLCLIHLKKSPICQRS